MLYDTIIVGGGCTGLGTAMYTGRLNMKTLLLAESIGGTITLTDNVENYPGFKRLTGEELAKKLEEHARDYPIDIIEEKVINIAKHKKDACFEVQTSKRSFRSKTVIFATGAKHRELTVPGAKEFENKGVHYCALCDGALYKGKVMCVVGGSDSAAKEALVLSEYAKKVYMVYRGEKIRPEPVNGERIKQKKNIEVITQTNVVQVKGDKAVNKVILDKSYNGNKELEVSAVFVAIGMIPLSDLAKNMGVKVNDKNEIMINRKSETNIEGFYAAGDVVDTEFKQAITGVSEGVTAAYHAFEYISKNNAIFCIDEEYLEEKNKK